MFTDTLDRNPPDLEKRLAFNVKVNELLGRTVSPGELPHLKLAFNNKWTPEATAEVLARMVELGVVPLSTTPGVEKAAEADPAELSPEIHNSVNKLSTE